MVLRRVLTTAIAASITLLLLSSTAHAALFLVFETEGYQPDGYVVAQTGGIGSPGEAVRARTGGRGALDPDEVMPAFLASGAYPSTIKSAEDLEGVEGLTPIGELRAGANGNGHLSFETPELASSDYDIVVFCRTCAAFSSGRNVVPVAPFRVIGTGASTRAATASWIAVLLALVAATAVSYIVIRRKRASASGLSPEAP
jgi:hypothetical protein